MIKVGIIGAGSLTAEELLKILLNHKNVEVNILHSETYQGKKVASVWPAFKNLTGLFFSEPSLQKIKEVCDCIFITRPHGKASEVRRGGPVGIGPLSGRRGGVRPLHELAATATLAHQ